MDDQNERDEREREACNKKQVIAVNIFLGVGTLVFYIYEYWQRGEWPFE